MGAFEPIAVVGRSCVLPDALTPEHLWRNVREGRSALSEAPPERWGLPRADALAAPGQSPRDRAWSDRGGYVRGFEAVFDPEGYRLPAGEVLALAPVFQWCLHAVRAALAPLGHDAAAGAPGCGLVMGNLSFPSAEMAHYAASVWLEANARALGGRGAGPRRPDPRNRFTSGLPAHLTARALGLGAGAFALDAACASSLYAIKLACDRLHDRTADRMVAGAVCAADDLFIHAGFTALEALSRTGRSRPFHRDADGLIPAEGAAFVVLERLGDAVAAGRRVLGVIRGIGLSNDGRGRGLLAPSSEGQLRAMRLAYQSAGLAPRDVSLIECHATGTRVGDDTELASMAALFEGARGVPIGSLKSNLGHLITAAGAAGLLKVLGAMESGCRPPTLHAEEPLERMAGSPFRLLHEPEPWEAAVPRRAAISAFGFGGNNAHLIVEEWAGQRAPAPAPRPRPRVAVVGMGARVAGGRDLQDLERAALAGQARLRPRDEGGPAGLAEVVEVGLDGLRFPPRDLEHALAQQLLMLEAAREATRAVRSAGRERTGVMIGMGCDPEIARYGARWRLATWMGEAGEAPDPGWVERAREAFVPGLEAQDVLGTMPNVAANRINHQLDAGGAGFTVSSEERSGLVALQLAARALEVGELDAVLVGAVDLSCEPVHEAALRELEVSRPPGDAAVALVLKRLDDALAGGEEIFAVLGDGGGRPLEEDGFDPDALVGHAHAASGLVRVAIAALACRRGALPSMSGIRPWVSSGPRRLQVEVNALEGQSASVTLEEHGGPRPPDEAALQALLAPRPDEPGGGARDRDPGRGPQAPRLDEPGGGARDRDPGRGPQALLAPRLDEPGRASLKVPAHRGAVSLPPRAPLTRPMAPAPWLPPILEDAPVDPEVEAPRPEQAREVARPRGPAAGARLPPSFGAGVALVAEAHRQHLAQQAATHQQFLLFRQRSLALLDRARTGAPRAALPLKVVLPNVIAPPAPIAPVALAPQALPGPKISRAQLEVLASGRISSVLGPLFERQDGFRRQVRMPAPPLLLADRITGIDAEPGAMGTGTIWTETFVAEDAWYLHDGHMPAGLMVEAGQADLLLISWLGADFQNRGERVYRLLGCELTFHGGLARPGETLAYDIHIDRHASQGEVRLFFFHYDCRSGGEPRLTVRNGQAGFFTDRELAESGGVLWDAATAAPSEKARVDPPAVEGTRRSFSAEHVRAFSEGRALECFGPGFERAETHVRTPRIQSGRMLLLGEVDRLDPRGGPWGRGALEATTAISGDDWFFAGHFAGDPCMPGTLMLEGGLQALAFYLAALGFTLERDGWRFEPVPEEPFALRCRGQVTPASRKLTYQLFVEELIAGPLPTVRADLLCTVDGLKAFHARRLALRLVPGWPLEQWKRLPHSAGQRTGSPVPAAELGGLEGYAEPRPVAEVNGFRFDRASLLACAWGRPSSAFGEMYRRFDGPRRVARLPGPPYHFISRVARIDAAQGVLQGGGTLEVEYDVPAESWYFEQNGHPTMPHCVLMEAALQPCGWLASYAGSALAADEDLLFRNLDGTATQLAEVEPGGGTLRTRVKLLGVSRSAGIILHSFEVTCSVGERDVYRMTTGFGFFPRAAFEHQPGLPVSPEEQARVEAPGNLLVDLTAGGPRLAGPMLRMIDRVDGFWPKGGSKGLGYLRARKDVRPSEWFFKAHFFQDPVQPGSLGIEALTQLLQLSMLHTGMAEGIPAPRFEPLALGRAVTWKYRGQVVPENRLITTELELTEVGRDASGPYAVATGWLWVDGTRIYQVRGLAMRIVPGREAPAEAIQVLDPARDTWLLDHRPTFTVPALPLMCMVDRLAAAAAAAAPGRVLAGLSGVQVHRWLAFPGGPVQLRTAVAPAGEGALDVTLLAWRQAATAALSRFEPVATGRVLLADGFPPPPAELPALEGRAPLGDPYATGSLFHGPAFQLLRSLTAGAGGSSAELDAGGGSVPPGLLHPALLDAATHAIPHDALTTWAPGAPSGIAYPQRIPRLTVHGPAPVRGPVRCEVRFAGFDGDDRHPAFHLQLLAGGRVWLEMRLVEVLLPGGPLAAAPPAVRRSFLRDRRFVPGLGLSTIDGARSRLRGADVAESDFLPGSVAGGWALRTSEPAELLVKEHVGRRALAHPAAVEAGPEEDGRWSAVAATRPLTRWPVAVRQEDTGWVAEDGGRPAHDFSPVRAYWRRLLGVGPWPVEDLYLGLAGHFVKDVICVDPEAMSRLRGRSCLYLANHQVGVESMLFSMLASALSGTPTLTLAKLEHRQSWIGRLIAHNFSYPGVRDPGLIAFFDREDRSALPLIIRELGEEIRTRGKSILVHVEGTRSLSCRAKVEKMSSAFIDLAVGAGVPIVPVRFSGGLPAEALPARIEFPVGHGRQDYWIGGPLMPETLGALPYADRRRAVLDAINGLGPGAGAEEPHPPDPALAEAAADWSRRTGASPEHATLLASLQDLRQPSPEIQALLEGARRGRLETGADPAGRWLAHLARDLFGPRGPRVDAGGET